MVTSEVTGVWEFYRDNCPGFKEPMRKQLRKVDSHMAELESQNAKLRELVRDMADAIVDWYDLMDGAFACESVYVDEKFAPLFDRMRELGVEVDE